MIDLRLKIDVLILNFWHMIKIINVNMFENIVVVDYANELCANSIMFVNGSRTTNHSNNEDVRVNIFKQLTNPNIQFKREDEG